MAWRSPGTGTTACSARRPPPRGGHEPLGVRQARTTRLPASTPQGEQVRPFLCAPRRARAAGCTGGGKRQRRMPAQNECRPWHDEQA
eukprot:1628750-Alexandrium_andersonii.AAC.1